MNTFFNKGKSENNAKNNESFENIKRVIIEILKPPFIEEQNFVGWFGKFCAALNQKMADFKNELNDKNVENHKLIDRFIEMQSEITNYKEILEQKSKLFEQEKAKNQESSFPANAKLDSFKIKIQNLQKNISDLE